ncbi:MAG TPA: DUF1028 domain-containing protein [Solirubrobacteraceae bacterium]|jgi:uncharacterized Ntn-hydrolase superfamily protein|nr:DUF1028 domain-containing protein [Solirubrobacteraceae bacterium]
MTFTILGRCPRTGRLGGAVTTSDVAVGARVLFGRAGVGVAATQHRTDPRLGPALLERLEGGSAPEPAVDAVAGGTRHRAWRQLGVVDARGRSAAYSGDRVWQLSAELPGDGCLVIGNMLSGPEVAPAMRGAFEQRAGDDLCDRLLAALDAGERAGGETGGEKLRSAALLVVERESFPFVDLRIDDDPEPLRRLGVLWETYRPLAEQFVARALTPDDVHRSSSTTT